MDEAENLRRQAKRAQRLAGSISDGHASEALNTHPATLVSRAQTLEQEVTPGQPQGVSSAGTREQQQ